MHAFDVLHRSFVERCRAFVCVLSSSISSRIFTFNSRLIWLTAEIITQRCCFTPCISAFGCPRLFRAMAENDVYRGAVAERIAELRTTTAWRPEQARALRVAEVRRPRELEDLAPDELRPLIALFRTEAKVRALLADPERVVELAVIGDSDGTVAVRLFAWNDGVSYSFDAAGKLLAFGSQHDVEHWHLGQRVLFFELDHALRAATPPLRQPIAFQWWNDGLWEELGEGEDVGDPMLADLR